MEASLDSGRSPLGVESIGIVDPEVGARGRGATVEVLHTGDVDLDPVPAGVAVLDGAVVGLDKEAEELLVAKRPGEIGGDEHGGDPAQGGADHRSRRYCAGLVSQSRR